MPVNGYMGRPNRSNTPNMNTYVTGAGRFANGLGPEYTNGLVAAHQAQQAQNNLTPYQRNYVAKFGGQTPGSPEPMAQAPMLPTGSRFATPRGTTYNDGTRSIYFQNGAGTGIVGKAASDTLYDRGFRQTDLAPQSPYAPQARAALQQVGQDIETAAAAARAAQPGGSLQMRNRQRDIAANQARGAAMAAARQGRNYVRSSTAKTASPLDQMLDEVHLQTISKQLEAIQDPAEKLAFIQSLRGKGKGGLPVVTRPTKPSMGSTLGAALGYDMTPGKPLYPGRFGGY